MGLPVMVRVLREFRVDLSGSQSFECPMQRKGGAAIADRVLSYAYMVVPRIGVLGSNRD